MLIGRVDMFIYYIYSTNDTYLLRYTTHEKQRNWLGWVNFTQIFNANYIYIFHISLLKTTRSDDVKHELQIPRNIQKPLHFFAHKVTDIHTTKPLLENLCPNHPFSKIMNNCVYFISW